MDNLTEKPKRRVWLKALFALSLAFNLLIVGAVAGAFWRHGGPDGPEGARPPSGGIAMLRAMEREDRRAVLRAARSETRDPGFERGAHEAALIAALRADPFEPAAFVALAEAQEAATTAHITAVSQAWQAQVLEMSDARRVAYAGRIADMQARRGAPRDDK